MADQFRSINEGGYIRTTPRSSPRSSRSLGSYYSPAPSTRTVSSSLIQSVNAAPSSGITPSLNEEQSSTPTQASAIKKFTGASSGKPTSSTSRSPAIQEHDDEGAATPTPSSPFANLRKIDLKSKESRRSNLPTAKPILKKSNSSESRSSSKSVSTVYQTRGEQQANRTALEESAVDSDDDTLAPAEAPAMAQSPARRYTATRFSEQVAVSIPKASTSTPRPTNRRSHGEGSQTSGKRNPVVVASTAASKRRPAVIRQRSSQVSQAKTSPSPPSPGILRRSAGSTPTTGQSPSAQATRRARAASPHLVGPKRRVSVEIEPTGEEPPSNNAKGKEQATRKPFPSIDPTFRSQFADQTRAPHRSFTNLSSLDRKSSAVTATAASYRAAGLLDYGSALSARSHGRGKDAFDHEIVPLKAPAPAGPELSEEQPTAPLPRTKSQLALLLEKNKAGNQEQQGKAHGGHQDDR